MKTVLLDLVQQDQIVQSVSSDTQFVLLLSGHSEDIKKSVELVFDVPGVSAEILGLSMLGPKELLDLTTISNHKVPNTSCVTKVKVVLQDKSKAAYVGKIIISKPAQQTSSFLEHSVLVNGEGTVSNSQPILEIEADDVKASHGSTTGRVDAAQVYYLMSRGLSRNEAQSIILEGFFESLLSTIIDQQIKERLCQQLIPSR